MVVISPLFGQALNGTYIIGSGGNYATITAAVSALNTYGVSGPVIFKIKNGTYNERITINQITGASSTNTITFRGESRTGTIISYSGSSTTNRATIILNGTDYVTFRNLTVTSTNTSYALTMWLYNNANYNNIDSCDLIVPSSTSSNIICFLVSAAESGMSAGINANYLTISNSMIKGGYYGLVFYGSSTSSWIQNNTVKNCYITNQYYYGIYSYYQRNFKVLNSTITNQEYSNAYGIINYYSTSSIFNGNYIQPGRYGFNIYYENYYAQSNISYFMNNMISGFAEPTYNTGIYAYYNYNSKYYHNSIAVTGNYNTSYSYAALCFYYAYAGNEVKNNILASLYPNGNLCFANYNPQSTVTVDYNDYYHPNFTANIFCAGTSYYTSFSAFKAVTAGFNTNHDVNSWDNVNPGFYSNKDLHIAPTTLMNAPVVLPSGYENDIDGDSRPNTGTVMIGADMVPNIDLDIADITPKIIVIGDNVIKIQVQNRGLTTIPSSTTLYFRYRIDGGSWVTENHTLTSDLKTGNVINFTFATKWNVSVDKAYRLTAEIYPQYSGDADAVDSVSQIVYVGMSGNYTINPTGTGNRNFTSFTNAVNALIARGIAGPVIFNIVKATFTERIVIPEINGASSTNRISFYGAGIDSTILQSTGSSTSDWITLLLHGADYLYFRDMTIRNLGTSYGIAVFLTNAANYNIFKHCKMSVPVTTSSYNAVLVASGSVTSVSSSGNTANYNWFDSNVMSGGYYGIRFYGGGTTSLIYGNKFTNNWVRDVYYYAWYMYYCGKSIYQFNKTSNWQSTNNANYGMMIYYGRGDVIDGNQVYGAGIYGMYVYYQNYYYTTDTSWITNNMLGNFVYSYNYGLNLYYGYNVNVYHNTIVINHTSTSTSYACIYLYYDYYCKVKNNIFVSSSSGGPAMYKYYGTWDNNSIDYNDYWVAGANFAYWEGTTYSSFSAWKSAVPTQNVNSWNLNPILVSASDPHLSTNSPIMLAPAIAIPYDYLSHDVDQESRPTTGNVFISADMPPPMIFDSIAVYAINHPIVFQGQNNAKMIRARVHFRGFAQPLSFSEAYFSTTGCTDVKDLKAIHFYSQDGTPLPATFEITSQNNPSGKITLTLPSGTTVADIQSIYVSYDIERKATVNNIVVVTFDSAVIDGTMRYTSKSTAGYATIVHPANFDGYCDVTRTTSGNYAIGIKRLRFSTIDNNTGILTAGLPPNNSAVQFYPSVIPTLYKKKTYTYMINHGELNSQSVNIYIDLNNDAYFSSTELIKSHLNKAEASITTDSITVSCDITPGYHRVRLSADFGSYSPSGCGSTIYGEVEDYLVYIADEEKPVITVSHPDTAYVKGLILFSATSHNDGDIIYEWDFDSDNIVDDVTTGKAIYSYNSTGTKAITVKATLRGCNDTLTSNSVMSMINIINPVGAPKVNFLTNLNTVVPGMTVKFFDLTTNGPYLWNYTITPDTVLGFAAYTYYPSNTVREPQVVFHQPGLYTVKLVATNINGSDSIIKTDYIEVVKEQKMCVDNMSTLKSGYLYDDGGRNNYSNPPASQNERTCGFLIFPKCAATITFDFLDFDVNSMIIGSCVNLPPDGLRIYDGKDNKGIPLHKQFLNTNGDTLYPFGFTNGTGNVNLGLPPSVMAKSGAMYIEWYVNCGAVNQGFEGKWSTTLITATPPDASFTVSDTVYVDQNVTFTNTSTGYQLEYEWDLDGDGWGDNFDMNPTYKYTSAKVVNVRLIVNSCDIFDTFYKKLVILMPTNKPVVNFEANYTKVTVKDEVTLSDKSDNTVHTWNWVITPSTYTLTEGNLSSKNLKLRFDETGTYTIKLIATNAKGTDSITKTNYITVYDPCIPLVAMLNSDIGISLVEMKNIKGDKLISQSSSIGVIGYSDFTALQQAKVAKGGKYVMTIARNTNFNNQTVSVFLDLNQNGSFNESGEEVKTIVNSDALNWTFDLPILNSYPEGLVRMRVAANAGQLPNKGCGPNVSGEFEDYLLIITKDYNKPVITLTGGNKITMNACDNYTEPGYSAFDEETGDITSDVIVTGTINSTVAGVYYKKYNVTDPAGNKADEVTREVEVLADIIKPKAVLKGKNPDSVEVYNIYTDQGYTPTDNCSGVKFHKRVDLVNTNIVGWQKIMYIVEDNAGNIDTTYRNVYVYDKNAPQIALLGKDTIEVEVFSTFIDPGTQQSDDYDNNLQVIRTGKLDLTKLGTYILSYCVSDSSGNGPVCIERIVKVIDKTPPQVNLLGSSVMTIDVFSKFIDPGFEVTDNYYKYSLGEVIVYVNGTVNTTKLGSYLIKYQAIDASGNVSAEIIRTVNVVDRVAPEIELLGATTIFIERWKAFVDPGVKVSDNYYQPSELTITYNQNGSYPGHTLQEGIYTYTYKVCDPSGNCSNEIYRTIYITPNVSIAEQFDITDIQLYPNPADNRITVTVDLPQYSNVSMSIYNTLGQKVREIFKGSAINFSQTIDISSLSNGVYYFRVETETAEAINVKFIITH